VRKLRDLFIVMLQLELYYQQKSKIVYINK